MQPMLSTLPAFLVASIYYLWRFYRQDWRRRRCLLHQRVAYLLWAVAQRIGYGTTTVGAHRTAVDLPRPGHFPRREGIT
jgi:hypothetical protein